MIRWIYWPMALIRVMSFRLLKPLIAHYWTLEINKISPVSGDVIILKVPENMPMNQIQQLAIQTATNLPKECVVKVIRMNADIVMGDK